MEGMREQLSKAVVLACVSEAHKQGRDCQVVAFSTERGIMEAGEITADRLGIQRLLDFLSHGFGGGTDVTGALKYAMTTLDTDVMAAADILLISDGEIPDPPIPVDLMEELDRLKLQRDVEVHGLLVGKHESKPLSRICCETHDFLIGYDTFATLGAAHQNAGRSSSSLGLSRNTMSSSARATGFFSSHRLGRPGTCLRAKILPHEDEIKRSGKRRRKNKSDDEYDDYGYDDYVLDETPAPEARESKRKSGNESTNLEGESTYLDEVNNATQTLKEAARKQLELYFWNADELLEERESKTSCWEHQSELKAAVERVGEGLVERQEESRLVVLSMMANEHILLLGVPGTGKSVLGRRLARLCNGAFFQRLLTRFTTPDELFGPLSLRSLENDEYRRCTAGFLPTASVAFLDELFKANSAILNTLLTILNERKFDNAGGQEDCPIRCVVGASNELPESDELAALYDRFLIRMEVLPLSDEGVLKMLSMPNPGASPCDDSDSESCDVFFSTGLQEVVEELSAAADSVVMGDHTCKLIVDLRTFMREEPRVQISDRRLAKAARLLKISAASHGRQKVDTVDCLLLQHCMWQLPEQKTAIKEWLLDNLTPGGDVGQFQFLLENLRQEILTAVRKTSGDVSGKYGARKADLAVIVSLRQEVSKIASILMQHQADLARHTELLSQSANFLWVDPDESLSTRQLLLPLANASLTEIKQLLVDAQALEMALSEGPDAPLIELRLSVIDQLWDDSSVTAEASFTDDELDMGMREAKAMYDLEKFRKWKRARKRARK
jgi:MoxR-like ATPase